MFIIVYAFNRRRRVSNIIVVRLSLRNFGHVIFGENVAAITILYSIQRVKYTQTRIIIVYNLLASIFEIRLETNTGGTIIYFHR